MTCLKVGCGGTLERADYNGVPLKVCDRCGAGWPVSSTAAPKGKSHYNAKPTDCLAGHHHPSKTEARVCEKLTQLTLETGGTLFQQPRFPLLAIAADSKNRPLYFTPDFALWRAGKLWRVWDAKSGKRRNREWATKKAAFEATYGIKVEEVYA